MDVGASGTCSFGLRMRNGSAGLPRSSLQPAQGQLSRRRFQGIEALRPSLHSMIRLSPSRRIATGKRGFCSADMNASGVALYQHSRKCSWLPTVDFAPCQATNGPVLYFDNDRNTSGRVAMRTTCLVVCLLLVPITARGDGPR